MNPSFENKVALAEATQTEGDRNETDGRDNRLDLPDWFSLGAREPDNNPARIQIHAYA
jgi:hypothetical protein